MLIFLEGGVLSYIFAVRNDDACLSIRRTYSPLKAELFVCDLSAVQVIWVTLAPLIWSEYTKGNYGALTSTV